MTPHSTSRGGTGLGRHARKEIIGGVSLSYLGIGIAVLVGMLFTPWLIARLGTSDYAILALAGTFASFMAIDFALPSAVTRFISRSKAEGDHREEYRYATASFGVFTVLALLILVLVLLGRLLLDSLFPGLSESELAKLGTVYLIVGVFIVLSIPLKPCDGILISHERFRLTQALTIAERVAVVGLQVLAILKGYGVFGAVLAISFAMWVHSLVNLLVVRRLVYPGRFLVFPRGRHYRDLMAFAGWGSLGSLAQRIFMGAPPIVLGAVANSREIAVFAVAALVESYIWMIGNAMGAFFMPEIARMVAGKAALGPALQRLATTVGRYQALLFGWLFGTFWLIGERFLTLWVGTDFTRSFPAAVLLIAPGMIIYSQLVLFTALDATGNIKYRATATFAGAVVALALCVPLASRFGAVGAAGAFCVGKVTGDVLLNNLVFRRRLQFRGLAFLTAIHVRVLPGLAIAFLLRWALSRTSWTPGWLGIIGLALGFSVLYALVSGVCFLGPRRLLSAPRVGAIRLRRPPTQPPVGVSTPPNPAAASAPLDEAQKPTVG